MRLIVLLFCSLLLVPSAALAKPLYVSGDREIMLRTGPSLENKILAILKTGQEVSLVSENGDYYLVTTPSGTRGYVLKNYMTDQAPAETRLREVERRTQQRIKELEEKTQKQEKELIALREERSQLLEAKQEAEETANQQADLASRLQAQHDASSSERARGWFVAGAGVLLTGVFLGWLWGKTGRRTRQSGLILDRF